MFDSISFVERRMLRIFVDPKAKEAVELCASREDMTETGIASRIYQWFVRQPEIVQKWILGHIPEEMRQDALLRIVKHLESQAAAPDPDDIEVDPLPAPGATQRRQRKEPAKAGAGK